MMNNHKKYIKRFEFVVDKQAQVNKYAKRIDFDLLPNTHTETPDIAADMVGFVNMRRVGLARGRVMLNIARKHETNEKTINEHIKEIRDKYNVNIVPIDTDEEYFSDETMEKSIQEKTFYISAESPSTTRKITEHLIRYESIKNKYISNIGNNKKSKKLDDISLQLGEKINEIKQNLRDINGGKEPSLNRIAQELNKNEILSPYGKKKWFAETVKRTNERYNTLIKG